MTPGHVQVWRVHLDVADPPEPTPGESARAARLRTPELARRYLCSHGALRTILGRFTDARLDFALTPTGKPWLPAAPEVKFNLSHSHDMALIAVSLSLEVGVDIERHRPLPDYEQIASRFFPPSEPPPLDERDFFRRWTRIEAMLKASGVGLYGAGAPIEGEWTVRELDAGPDFAAAVAAAGPSLDISIHDYESLNP